MSSHDPQDPRNAQARQPSPRPAAPGAAPARGTEARTAYAPGRAPKNAPGCAATSVRDLLAACAAARAVSTPPAEPTEHAAPESAASRATTVRDAPPSRNAA